MKLINKKERQYIASYEYGLCVTSTVESETDVVEYETLKEMIGRLLDPFERFEIVRFSVGGYSYLMILDDEGKLFDKPINEVATDFYGQWPYDCIVGDVIFLSDHHDCEMYFLSDDEERVLREAIMGGCDE